MQNNLIKSWFITKQFSKAFLVLLYAGIVGCAAPATKNIELSKDELRQERNQHRNIAQNGYGSKSERLTPKHQDIGIYQARLNRVAPKLMAAAKQICKSGNCNYTFRIVKSNELNAWADGHTVNITPVMMDFLTTDQELSLILSHELAHNAMGHIRKKQQNVLVGALVDIVAAANGVNTQGAFSQIGSASYSQGFENEADYIAIYIMAISGNKIDNAQHVWRKMTTHMPHNIESSFFSSHPSNPERFLRMQKAIDEVKQKIARGEKLQPNYK